MERIKLTSLQGFKSSSSFPPRVRGEKVAWVPRCAKQSEAANSSVHPMPPCQQEEPAMAGQSALDPRMSDPELLRFCTSLVYRPTPG